MCLYICSLGHMTTFPQTDPSSTNHFLSFYDTLVEFNLVALLTMKYLGDSFKICLRYTIFNSKNKYKLLMKPIERISSH